MKHAITILLVFWGLCNGATNARPVAVSSEVLFSKPYFFEEEEEYHIADTTFQEVNDSINKVRLGFRLGLGVSNVNFNKGYPKPEARLDVVWKPSFSAGLILKIPVYKKLSFQQEYLYTNLKGEVKDHSVSYELSYMSLPVLLMYEAAPKLSFILGPHFDLLIQANEDYSGTSTNITHYIEERSIGGVVGISYCISNAVQLDGRYSQGLNHIGIRQGVLAKEFKTGLLLLSIYIYPFK